MSGTESTQNTMAPTPLWQLHHKYWLNKYNEMKKSEIRIVSINSFILYKSE